MVKNVQFRTSRSHFQIKLNNTVRDIDKCKKLIVPSRVPTKISEKKSRKKKQKSKEMYQKKNCLLERVREKLN